MQKFKHYITEAKYTNDDFFELIEKNTRGIPLYMDGFKERLYSLFKTEEKLNRFINIDIKFYVSKLLSKNVLFYRGMKNQSDPIKIHKVRQDRVPADTPEHYHHVVNAVMNKKFGGINRSNTLFVVKRFAVARTYGRKNTFIVFPIKKFDWVSSDEIEDLYNRFEDYANDGRDVFTSGKSIEDNLKDDVEQYYKKNIDLVSLPASNEIMIHCKNYLAVRIF
jgi:hypothetical protein